MLKWRIGDVTITKLVEMEVTGPAGGEESFLTEAYPDIIKTIPWLVPHFATPEGDLSLSIHALLVETPGARIIVDTCVGNDKKRQIPMFNMLGTRFLQDLAAADWPRESVDGILCTHLHIDHVGWNTMLVEDHWVPTFPNAKYYFGRAEYEHWSKEFDNAQARKGFSEFANAMMDTSCTFSDSVQPIIEAGLAVLVETTTRITPEISLKPTPGHTPGHVSVIIESKGERAVITGDMMHHPCQIARPEWSSAFDSDGSQSEKTRRAFFAEFADTPTLIIGTHFAGPTAGRLVRENNAYRLAV